MVSRSRGMALLVLQALWLAHTATKEFPDHYLTSFDPDYVTCDERHLVVRFL